jgi:hypothetical protein
MKIQQGISLDAGMSEGMNGEKDGAKGEEGVPNHCKSQSSTHKPRPTSFSCSKDDLPFATFMESDRSMLAMETIAHRVRIATHGPTTVVRSRPGRKETVGWRGQERGG